MSAQIIQLKGCGVAYRFTRLLATEAGPEGREEAIARFQKIMSASPDAGLMTHARIDEQIEQRREALLEKLRYLDSI